MFHFDISIFYIMKQIYKYLKTKLIVSKVNKL